MMRLTIIPPRIAGIISRHVDVFRGWLYKLKTKKRKYPSGIKPIILMRISRKFVSFNFDGLVKSWKRDFQRQYIVAVLDVEYTL
jgi:hypothetical protein